MDICQLLPAWGSHWNHTEGKILAWKVPEWMNQQWEILTHTFSFTDNLLIPFSLLLLLLSSFYITYHPSFFFFSLLFTIFEYFLLAQTTIEWCTFVCIVWNPKHHVVGVCESAAVRRPLKMLREGTQDSLLSLHSAAGSSRVPADSLRESRSLSYSPPRYIRAAQSSPKRRFVSTPQGFGFFLRCWRERMWDEFKHSERIFIIDYRC